MVKGKKRFEFLTFDVDVVLRDDVPPGLEEGCSGGIYNILDKTEKITGVTIWFKDMPNMEIVSHECYHLFMRILGFVDDRAYTFEELNAEIYAYKFGELGKRVLLALKAMPYYKVLGKQMCEEEKR